MNIPKRLLEKIDIKSFGCWGWKASCTPAGYGKINVNGKTKTASRLFYSLFIGQIYGELCVCHTCDNPPCCNPDHLYLGSCKDNMRDRENRKRLDRSKWTKFSDGDIRNIRLDYNSGKYTARELAKKWDCCSMFISQICRFKRRENVS